MRRHGSNLHSFRGFRHERFVEVPKELLEGDRKVLAAVIASFLGALLFIAGVASTVYFLQKQFSEMNALASGKPVEPVGNSFLDSLAGFFSLPMGLAGFFIAFFSMAYIERRVKAFNEEKARLQGV